MKNPKYFWIQCWLGAWVELICAGINILTFTLYRPWWDFSLLAYFTKKNLKKEE